MAKFNQMNITKAANFSPVLNIFKNKQCQQEQFSNLPTSVRQFETLDELLANPKC